ncbi:hypothetical protein DV737_g4873, partial [Chaetothyriales sp. CBS 132003]
MSTEVAAAVAESPEKPSEKPAEKPAEKPEESNAAAADDAKKLLAELEHEVGEAGGAGEAGKAGDAGDAGEAGGAGASSSKPDRDGHRDGHRGRGRGGGRGGRGGRFGGGRSNHKDNIKSDLTTQKESSDPVEIRKQVEFYFSDGNLPYDKFLLSAVGGSKNNAVELATIHSFKRMRHFQPFSAIVDALKESTLLELTNDDTCVRRKEPLPAEFDDGPAPNAVRIFEDRAMPRCVYAKGFGDEAPSTQFDIEAFFAPYGPTNAVRLRRTEDKLFKGSVFVEFATEELASAFLALDPKPQFRGRQLQIMSKKEYCDKKVQDIKAGKIKANMPRERSGNHDHSRAGRGDRRGGRSGRDRDGDRDRHHGGKRKRDGGGGGDGDDGRDWRVRREEDRKNGFRDGNKRRSGGDLRDRDSGSSKVETDQSGIPTVKPNKADALAKAKAVVDGEEAKKSEPAETAETEQTGKIAANGKKREREEDVADGGEGDGNDGRQTKKSRPSDGDGGNGGDGGD